MTEQDPAATFRLDQEAAQSEQATRDQEAYEMQKRQAAAHASLVEAQAMSQTAYALRTNAMAEGVETIANALGGAIAILTWVAAAHGLKRLVTRR